MQRLDKDLWEAVSPLLDRALDLDADARASAPVRAGSRASASGADRSAVFSQEHDRLLGSDFLEVVSRHRRSSAFVAGGPDGGRRTRSTCRLGMGGMGTVWRARRSDGRFEGFVAVKLLNLALIGHEGDERFKREGTMLARLAHPHIARLLDAGVTSAAQPYLVLEYVEGTRIDWFADERQSGSRGAPRVVPAGCRRRRARARQLIVHRDLKPSNILVTRRRFRSSCWISASRSCSRTSPPKSRTRDRAGRP